MNILKVLVKILLLGYSFSVYSQLKCKSCKYSIYHEYLKSYISKENIEKVNQNLTLNFQNNIERDIPCIDEHNWVTLKFKKNGSIYKFDKDKFSNSITLDTSQITISLVEEDSDVDPLVNSILRYFSNEEMKKNYSELNTYSKRINEIVNKGKINQVVFMIHGYNLPYSISQIQYNNLVSQYKEDSPVKINRILFIKVFWPSINQKKVVYRKGFYEINDKLKITSVYKYKNAVATSILVANSIRYLLNNLDNNNIPIDFIGHSMGSLIITTIFNDPDYLYQKNKNSSKTNDLKQIFENNALSESIKKKNINLLLNAPAMGGKRSFSTNQMVDKQIKWTMGYNPHDKVLSKTFSFIRFGDHNGNTRLGCNWKEETWTLKDHLESIGQGKNFKFIQSGIQKDIKGHDFFCYLNQRKFQVMLKNFIQSK